jgi:predicted Zn-dependent protease
MWQREKVEFMTNEKYAIKRRFLMATSLLAFTAFSLIVGIRPAEAAHVGTRKTGRNCLSARSNCRNFRNIKSARQVAAIRAQNEGESLAYNKQNIDLAERRYLDELAMDLNKGVSAPDLNQAFVASQDVKHPTAPSPVSFTGVSISPVTMANPLAAYTSPVISFQGIPTPVPSMAASSKTANPAVINPREWQSMGFSANTGLESNSLVTFSAGPSAVPSPAAMVSFQSQAKPKPLAVVSTTQTVAMPQPLPETETLPSEMAPNMASEAVSSGLLSMISTLPASSMSASKGTKRDEELIRLAYHAISINPGNPDAYRRLGVLYGRMGQMPQSIAAYEEYLKYASHPDRGVRNLVENYRMSRNSQKNAPDYLSEATHSFQEEIMTWQTKSSPVRVYIPSGNASQSYAPPVIMACLNAWEKATNGRLRFLPVINPQNANILITFQEGTMTDTNAHVGNAEYIMPEDQYRKHRLSLVKVSLNTGDAETRRRLQGAALSKQFYRMALHELGHAIGIWGHSSDPGDVMFARPIAENLSDRDVSTVRKIYGLEATAALSH